MEVGLLCILGMFGSGGAKDLIKGLLAMDSCFDSCAKYFVTKYLIEQHKEEDVAILAPGGKGPAWDHIAPCVGTEHRGGRSVWQRLEAELHF